MAIKVDAFHSIFELLSGYGGLEKLTKSELLGKELQLSGERKIGVSVFLSAVERSSLDDLLCAKH